MTGFLSHDFPQTALQTDACGCPFRTNVTTLSMEKKTSSKYTRSREQKPSAKDSVPETSHFKTNIMTAGLCSHCVWSCCCPLLHFFQNFWASRAPRRMTLSLNIAQRCGKVSSTCGWECIMTQTVSAVWPEDCDVMSANFRNSTSFFKAFGGER